MAMFFCPSCNNRISGNLKNCPHCGFLVPETTHARKPRLTAKAIVFVIIIFLIAVFLERERLFPWLSKEVIQAVTLKNMDGEEYFLDDIILKFNSFMQDEGADSLKIVELTPVFGETDDIYREIKDDISISMLTPKGSAAVIAVYISAQNNGKPTTFITCSLALISIFNPTMKADIRQKVLFDMMGYEESGSSSLNERHIYTIDDTKYTFEHSKKRGLSMLIEQNPKLKLDSEDLSVQK